MKLMETRKAMIEEAHKVLNVLGAEDIVNVATEENVIVPQITINKGQIVAVTDPRDQEEIDNLYKEIGRHIGRINQLAVENDELKESLNFKELLLNEFRDNMDEKIQTIHTLEKQLADAQARINELTNTAREEEPVMEQQTVETYDKNDAVLKALYEKLELLESKLPKTKLKEVTQKHIDKTKEEIAARIEELKNCTDSIVTMTVTDQHDHCVEGTVKVNDKEYLYRASSRHHNPLVFGAMDTNIITKVKDMIINRTKAMNIGFSFNFSDSEFDEVVYRTEDNIVVWRTIEGQYKGYTDKYIFVWDGKAAVPMRKLMKNALNDKKTLYKPMNGSNGSKAQKIEGERIMTLIKDIFADDFAPVTNDDNKEYTNDNSNVVTNDDVIEDTNEIVVDTNDNNAVEESDAEGLWGVDDME